MTQRGLLNKLGASNVLYSVTTAEDKTPPLPSRNFQQGQQMSE